MAVLHPEMPNALEAKYEQSLAALKRAGAILVDVDESKLDGLFETMVVVLTTELKVGLAVYLATTPAAVKTRTLEEIIAFNEANPAEMSFIGQEIFLDATKTRGLADPKYLSAREKSLRLAGTEGIDAMLKTAHATILVQPSFGMAGVTASGVHDNRLDKAWWQELWMGSELGLVCDQGGLHPTCCRVPY